MESVTVDLSQMLVQLPIVALVIAVGLFFLKRENELRATFMTELEKRDDRLRETLSEIGQDAHAHGKALTESTNEVLERNTRALEKTWEMHDELLPVIGKLTSALDRIPGQPPN